MVADSSKYGQCSLFCVVPLNELTDIITDNNLSPEAQNEMNNNNFILHLV